jgi:hypothetical protein
MDSFTQDHLAAWAEYTLHDDERQAMVGRITSFVLHHPKLIADGRSWPEIVSLMERNARLGIAG